MGASAGPAFHRHGGRQRGGTHRLSPEHGPVLLRMLSVSREGAWGKAMRDSFTSGTAFPQDLHHREHGEGSAAACCAPALPWLMAAPELAAFHALHGTVMIPGNREVSANLSQDKLVPRRLWQLLVLSSAQPGCATATHLGSLRAVPGQLSCPTGPPSSRAVARMPPGRPGPARVWLVTCMAGMSLV